MLINHNCFLFCSAKDEDIAVNTAAATLTTYHKKKRGLTRYQVSPGEVLPNMGFLRICRVLPARGGGGILPIMASTGRLRPKGVPLGI